MKNTTAGIYQFVYKDLFSERNHFDSEEECMFFARTNNKDRSPDSPIFIRSVIFTGNESRSRSIVWSHFKIPQSSSEIIRALISEGADA